MNKEELIARLLGTFVVELEENVSELNKGLLALEKGSMAKDGEKVLARMFRAAHSLKGAARAVDVGTIEAVCHRLEDIFSAARDGRLNFSGELFQALFSAVDAIEDAGRRLRDKAPLDEARLGELIPTLESLARGAPDLGEGTRPRRESVAAPTADPPSSSGGDEAVAARAAEGQARSFVRLPAERLDALVATSGELLVARLRVEAQTHHIERIEGYVEGWEKEWTATHRLARRARRVNGKVAAAALPAAAPGTSRGPAMRPAARRDETRDRLRWLRRELHALAAGFQSEMRNLAQTAGPLEAAAEVLRMAPFADACAGLERAVRDLATAAGKEVDLVVAGGELEIDRDVLDGLKSPLLHLVRNAIDHGIETPAERTGTGKPAAGRVTIEASLKGTRVRIVVADDGRGLDIAAIRSKVRAKGMPEPDSDRELVQLVFLPGLTTSALITEVSGRGVGLDVVKTEIETRRGTVEVRFEPGRGTRFILDLPLTLSRLRAVLVEAGQHTYALDVAGVQRLLRISAADIRSAEGREVVVVDGEAVPLVSLHEVLGLRNGEEQARGHMLPAAVVATASGRAVFVVDALVAEQEIVAKSLGERLGRLKHATGVTVLPTGRLALILNAASLLDSALGHTSARRFADFKEETGEVARKRMLVVDDSVTTRTLVSAILQASDYEVLTVADGMEAWQLLQEREVDLVVSDVEMPRMDGFTLTETIRGSPRLKHLPVVLVTARETDADKARGLEVGADAYLPKSSFDQKRLLETIAQLL